MACADASSRSATGQRRGGAARDLLGVCGADAASVRRIALRRVEVGIDRVASAPKHLLRSVEALVVEQRTNVFHDEVVQYDHRKVADLFPALGLEVLADAVEGERAVVAAQCDVVHSEFLANENLVLCSSFRR